MEFTPHSEKQERALFSTKKIIALCTGLQYGKTTCGAVFIRRLIHIHNDPTDAFLIVAPTYKIMHQSTWPAFKTVMDGIGRYSKVDACYYIKDGPTVYMRTATDPDSIVGITNVQGIWGDEAGLFSLLTWENMQGRAAFKNCQIILTTTPYSRNWVYKELIMPTEKGIRDDVEYIRALSIENPYFPMESYYSRKKVMDPRRFAMLFGGDWGKKQGLVYDCFEEEYNVCEPFELPAGTVIVAGVDWGYNDPFVIMVRAITPDNEHYEVSEFYKTQLRLPQMIDMAARLKKIWGIQRFYCDPSQPGYIAEFNANGLTAIGADNSIDIGIERHYELIKSRRYKVFKGQVKYLLDEYESYHYEEPKDLRPDQKARESKPVDANNHCSDATRYVSIHTHKGQINHVPTVPGERPFEKGLTRGRELTRLLKKPNEQSEKFS